MEHRLYAKLSRINSAYYIIYLNDRGWRVCHKTQLHDRYPDIEIKES